MITDPTELKGTIIGHRGDRFGGRLAAVLSAIRAADIQNIPFRVCWSTPPDWEEVCHPEDLFSQEFMDQKFIDQKTFNSIRWKAKQLGHHVDDLADALAFVMEHYPDAAEINIGTSEEISIKGLTKAKAAAAGYTGAIVHETTKPHGTPRKLMDSRRLLAMGWAPRIPLAKGLTRTIAEYEMLQSS